MESVTGIKKFIRSKTFTLLLLFIALLILFTILSGGSYLSVNMIKEQKAVENFMEISLQTKQQVEEIESTSKYSENEIICKESPATSVCLAE